MKIGAISDLHGFTPDIPKCDILIIAGDCTSWDFPENWVKFSNYVDSASCQHVILVAGNHDGALENYPLSTISLFDERVIYLQDKSVRIDGIKFYGSPWTPTFFDWYFMKGPDELAAEWAKIPEDTDILITHGPPFGILDCVNGLCCGDQALMERVKSIKPLHHIFGHIHEGAGDEVRDWRDGRITHFHNVAYCNGRYKPTGKFLEIPDV